MQSKGSSKRKKKGKEFKTHIYGCKKEPQTESGGKMEERKRRSRGRTTWRCCARGGKKENEYAQLGHARGRTGFEMKRSKKDRWTITA